MVLFVAPTRVDPDTEWEEYFYHTSVRVRGGYVETDDPLVIEGLLSRFYDIVDQPKKTRKREEGVAAGAGEPGTK